MSANVFALGASTRAGAGQILYPDGPAQWRLAVVLGLSLVAVAASFSLENLLLPWRVRMDATTPGWCFVLSQASVFGFVAALAVRGGWVAVVQALLAATLLGYAYVLAGAALIDPRRAVQYAHLIFRAVELGLVAVAAMAIGATLRLLVRQRLLLVRESAHNAVHQYRLGELMFLIVVFAVGLGLVNLFFDHFNREEQLADIVLAIFRALPAALPWLWGLTQPRLTWSVFVMVLGFSLALLGIKAAIEYAVTAEELAVVLPQAAYRAAAYAVGAAGVGVVLRALGFRWCMA